MMVSKLVSFGNKPGNSSRNLRMLVLRGVQSQTILFLTKFSLSNFEVKMKPPRSTSWMLLLMKLILFLSLSKCTSRSKLDGKDLNSFSTMFTLFERNWKLSADILEPNTHRTRSMLSEAEISMPSGSVTFMDVLTSSNLVACNEMPFDWIEPI